ncbi:MAG: hypothetical protein EXX96DRAFT_607215 [Benjaminiella poitrasii]|nr:MAG: hypothetical protein EXX96DRAFT_607215 [Benjaminiella poitrasii]
MKRYSAETSTTCQSKVIRFSGEIVSVSLLKKEISYLLEQFIFKFCQVKIMKELVIKNIRLFGIFVNNIQIFETKRRIENSNSVILSFWLDGNVQKFSWSYLSCIFFISVSKSINIVVSLLDIFFRLTTILHRMNRRIPSIKIMRYSSQGFLVLKSYIISHNLVHECKTIQDIKNNKDVVLDNYNFTKKKNGA